MGETAWNGFWKLDRHPNAFWMGNLETYLKKTFWSGTIVEHIEWSGSAAPWKEEEARAVMKEKLRETAKKHPNKPIICICKSLAGPYLMRALRDENWVTVTQFIALWSPWWTWDTIPDNVSHTSIITSENDIFKKVGDWFRFWNLRGKIPKRQNPKLESPTEIKLELPTHGELNHDSPTWEIEITNRSENLLSTVKSVESMYALIAMIIKSWLAEARG